MKLILGEHFRKIAHPFFLQHYIWHDLWFTLYTLEVLCGHGVGCLAFCSCSCSTFSSSVQDFFLGIAHQFGPPPSCSSWGDSLHLWQPLKHVGTHFFCCSQSVEWTPSHIVVWNAFACIAKSVGFYVLHEQTYVLLLPSLQSFHWWVDIM
jgi:hypothetical protein